MAGDMLDSGTQRMVPLHLASENLTAMQTYDRPTALSVTGTAGGRAADADLFGLLLRENIPCDSAGALNSANVPETEAASRPERRSLPQGASAEREFADDDKLPPAAGQRSVASSSRSARLPSAFRQREDSVPPSTGTSADIADEQASRAAAEGASRTETPNPLSDPDAAVTQENAAKSQLAATQISPAKAGPDPTSTDPAAEDTKAEPSTEMQPKKQTTPATVVSSEAGRRSETPRKVNAAGTKPVSSRSSHASDSTSAALTGIVPAPVAKGGTSVVGSLQVSDPAACPAGMPAEPSGDLSPRGSRSHLPPSLQSSPSPAAQPAAGLALTHQVPGTVSSLAAGARGATHDIRTGNLAASSQRAFQVTRPPGALGADGQRAPSTAAVLPQTGSLPQVPGTVNSAVTSHPSTASSDPSLRPSAAFERMDTAEAPRVLETSPQNLAVGVRDASLGWVEIRAHAVTGQVAATLASGTHEAHTAIAADLPAIRDTLISQHVALHSLSAERFPASAGDGSSSSNSSASGTPHRSSFAKPKAETASAHGEAEAETLSYISVRV